MCLPPMQHARNGARLGYVSYRVQSRLSGKSGHGKRLLADIDLTHKQPDHDHSIQASRYSQRDLQTWLTRWE